MGSTGSSVIGVAGGLRASSIDTLLFGNRAEGSQRDSGGPFMARAMSGGEENQVRGAFMNNAARSSVDGLLGTRRTTLNINNDDNSRAFTVKSTTNSELRSFLTYWRGRANTVQRNADNTYTRVFREAVGRGMPQAEARRLASAARTETVKRAMAKATGENTRFPGITIK